jgi:hypothetical protein
MTPGCLEEHPPRGEMPRLSGSSGEPIPVNWKIHATERRKVCPKVTRGCGAGFSMLSGKRIASQVKQGRCP